MMSPPPPHDERALNESEDDAITTIKQEYITTMPVKDIDGDDKQWTMKKRSGNNDARDDDAGTAARFVASMTFATMASSAAVTTAADAAAGGAGGGVADADSSRDDVVMISRRCIRRGCGCDECGDYDGDGTTAINTNPVPRTVLEAIERHKRRKIIHMGVRRTQVRTLIKRHPTTNISLYCYTLPLNAADPLVEFGNSHRLIYVGRLSSASAGDNSRSMLMSIGSHGIIGSRDEEQSRVPLDWHQGQVHLMPSTGGKAVGWVYCTVSPPPTSAADRADDGADDGATNITTMTMTSPCVLYVAKIPSALVQQQQQQQERPQQPEEWYDIVKDVVCRRIAQQQRRQQLSREQQSTGVVARTVAKNHPGTSTATKSNTSSNKTVASVDEASILLLPPEDARRVKHCFTPLID